MKTSVAMLSVLLTLSGVAAAEFNAEIVPFKGYEANHYTSISNPGYREGQPDHLRHWNIIQLPTGGYIGDVIIRDNSAVGGIARLRVRELSTKDLFTPENDAPKPKWFSDMGLRRNDSPDRALVYEHEWELDSLPRTIPIVLSANTGKNIGRCVFEVLDRNRRVIYSCVPAEVYAGGGSWDYGSRASTAWIMTDDDTADRKIRKLAKISSIASLTEIPGDWRRFLDVQAIWIGADTDLSVTEIRRIILSGGWIFGTPEGLAPHLANLGLQPTPVLMGGIGSLTANIDADMGEIDSPSYGGQSLCFSSSYGNRALAAPLEDTVRLFERIRGPFMRLTFITAGLYVVGTTILLPLLFIRLKGSRRVRLWWRAPIVIGVYTLVAVAVGWFTVHPKAPLSDCTEYRLGYGNWPEVFCNVNATVLKYGRGLLGWQYPAPAEITYSRNSDTALFVHENIDGSGSMGLGRTVRGMQYQHGFCHMKKMRQPFTARMMPDGKVQVASERDVRNLYAKLQGHSWLKLGDLNAGATIIIGAPFRKTEIGFPSSITQPLETWDDDGIVLEGPTVSPTVCKNCGRRHEHGGLSLAGYEGGIILAALDANDRPMFSGLHREQDHTERVAWICQVPLEGYVAMQKGK